MNDTTNVLVGTWKLVSCVLEDVKTKEQKSVWGTTPNGYIVMTPESRWIVIQTAEGRRAPLNDEDRVAAFKSLLAYSGKYRTEQVHHQCRYRGGRSMEWHRTCRVRCS